MLRKFVALDCTQETVPLMDFLENLEAATTFDPKKCKAAEGEKLLWDYKKATGGNNAQEKEVVNLLSEDIHFLSRHIWIDMEMPKRFIPQSSWTNYQLAFEQSPDRPSWDLAPIFAAHPGKKIHTFTHHYLKIKQIVVDKLKKGYEPIYNGNKTKPRLKNFGVGVLISVSMVAMPYVDADIDFLGEPPSTEEVKRNKLKRADESLLSIFNQFWLNSEHMPLILEGKRYGVKSKAWEMARKLEDLFPNKTTFDQCWRRLKRSGKIKYENESLET